MTHPGCKTPFSLDALYTVWNYEGVVRKSILTLKYRFAKEISKELGFLLKNELPEELQKHQKPILVPVPMAKKRENWRGFNQTNEIAKILSLSLGWGYCPNLLIKKFSNPQTNLKGEERRKNIKGKFVINKDFSELDYKIPIVVFDDVLTTGSTLKEAGGVLKRNGFQSVFGLTIARSI